MAEAEFPLAADVSAPADAESASASGPLTLNELHCAEGLARLLEQFKGKPRIESVLCVFLDQVQDAEQALWEVLTERDLDTAIGVQLDGLGQVVVQERMGLSDDNYRAFLRARILVNLSDGQGNELLNIVETALTTADMELIEWYPAAMTLSLLDALLIVSPNVINSLLQSAKAAAVRLVFVYHIASNDDVHSFGAEADYPETDSLRGFDDAQSIDSTGGHYAGALDETAPRF